MTAALDKNRVKRIYNLTSGYYDWYHRLGTFNQDGRGRKFLVDHSVKEGDFILDAGGGPGTTGLMALEKAGASGRLVILDASENMLEQAKLKAAAKKLSDQVTIQVGDMYEIPYPDDTFDVVFSTYSTCPLENPAHAVLEMLRVVKPGGLVGIAHSANPDGWLARFFTDAIEKIIWQFPRLSLGCRKFDMSADLQQMDATILEDKLIGFVPWYFRLIILRKT